MPNIKITKLAALSWLAVVIPAGVFGVLAVHVARKQSLAFDLGILGWLRSIATPELDSLFLFLTKGGNATAIVALTAVIALYLLCKHRNQAALMLFAGVAGAVCINLILKVLFQRVRPDLWQTLISEQSFSFPSGHATATSALAFAVILIVWPSRWRWWAVAAGSLYVIAVGLSRPYLGVHFPSDILAGWCASWLCVLATYRLILYHPWRKKSDQRPI